MTTAKHHRESIKDMLMECLALLGVCAIAAVLALAFRIFEGKW